MYVCVCVRVCACVCACVCVCMCVCVCVCVVQEELLSLHLFQLKLCSKLPGFVCIYVCLYVH